MSELKSEKGKISFNLRIKTFLSGMFCSKAISSSSMKGSVITLSPKWSRSPTKDTMFSYFFMFMIPPFESKIILGRFLSSSGYFKRSVTTGMPESPRTPPPSSSCCLMPSRFLCLLSIRLMK